MKIKIGVLLLISLLFVSCCKKNEDTNETLPPATQTGEGTFACYVNGEAFIDKSGGYFNCFYQYVDGEYRFHLSGIVEEMETSEVSLGSHSIELEQGVTYNLIEPNPENANGHLFFSNTLSGYDTDHIHRGMLTITRFDLENNIISGTFSFSILNTDNNTIYNITEGRFDTLFTQ